MIYDTHYSTTSRQTARGGAAAGTRNWPHLHGSARRRIAPRVATCGGAQSCRRTPPHVSGQGIAAGRRPLGYGHLGRSYAGPVSHGVARRERRGKRDAIRCIAPCAGEQVRRGPPQSSGTVWRVRSGIEWRLASAHSSARVQSPPPAAQAKAYVVALRATPNAVIIAPGDRHWEIFTNLLQQSRVIGNLVSEAWYAALAIEHGCEWVTDDADFARFAGLRWRRPA